MRNLGLTLVAAFSVASAIPATSNAAIIWQAGESYTISEIQDAGGVVVGDKLFADFSVVSTASPSVTSAPDASTILIKPFINAAGDIGLEFFDGWAVATGQHINTNIQFSVEATAPWMIDGTTLGLTSFGANFGGIVSIAENLFATDPSNPPFDFVIEDGLLASYAKDDPANQLMDSVAFDPISKMWVVKDITVRGGVVEDGQIGHAHLSRFYQIYHQIPEPASLALMGLGAMVLLRRRA
ncbi:MAG: PEP-CTERM sorting domain-containing protein [Phycisphaeraceae bacterium]|nr:PEP-CTERM sorting domain-containing protein [Phycisphaeraceae bacterium]